MFEDAKDVEEWLEPLGYEAFWREIAEYPVSIQSRESCDAQIAAGTVDEALVLQVLKGMVRSQIVLEQDLKPRLYAAEMSLH